MPCHDRWSLYGPHVRVEGAPRTRLKGCLRNSPDDSYSTAMCGRYSITTPVEALSRLFRFAGPLPNLRPRYNVSPTQQVPIVRRARDDGERELAQVRWGLIPFWARDEKIGYKLINARAEGIDAKPSFREAFKRGRRCLIPADGFYEWAKNTKPKQPWRISSRTASPSPSRASGSAGTKRQTACRSRAAPSSRRAPANSCARFTTACR